MKTTKLAALALFLLIASPACARDIGLGVEHLGDTRVRITIWGEGRLRADHISLYRSTTHLADTGVDTLSYPVAVLRPGPDTSGRTGPIEFIDSMTAHNCTYYYRARVGNPAGPAEWSNMDSVRIPDAEIGTVTGSSLLLDKLNYFLEVRDGGQMKKRYPVALGQQPRNRKLHMDRASTPEGIYCITNEQPDATFYKAFDLDYPNPVDRARYAYAKEAGLMQRRSGDYPDIGGEIQIHGEGISSNWTFGCIALRNEDMDELFAHDRVGSSMPVYITGIELTRRDLSSILDYRSESRLKAIQRRLRSLGYYEKEADGIIGTGTRLALARFQAANGLAPTCDFDGATVRLLARLD